MRPGVPVALVTAASLIGDTLLYTALPVNAARLGVEPFMVGVILSANRWVRLATNPVAARLYERMPAGPLVLAAIVLAAISTALYAEPAWIIGIVAARLLWGFCWSMLRLGSFLAAVDDAGIRPGRDLGNTRAIFGLGYLAGAVYAPFAVEAFGWRVACLAGAALTVVGLVPALLVRSWRRVTSAALPSARASAWEPRLVTLFAIGAVQLALYAGLIPVVGGTRIAELFADGGTVLWWVLPATFIAAVFVLSLRVGQVVWQPVVGHLADRALHRTFAVSTVLAATGIAALALPVDAGAFVVAGAVANLAGLAGVIAVEVAVTLRCAAAERPRILAALHTWQDAGSAAGALGGGALVAIGTSSALLIGGTLVAATLPLWWLATVAQRRVVVT